MNTEQSSDLARRAAVHAALADPARLLITDALSEGDASPSELATLLGMPSNLVAHHLAVLEQADLVSRRRSEGDRRRTYLRLVPGAFDSLARPGAQAARRVLFVCTANSARSHLAAALWRRASEIPAASAGTRPAAASRIIFPVGVGLISRGPTGAAGLTTTTGSPSRLASSSTARSARYFERL